MSLTTQLDARDILGHNIRLNLSEVHDRLNVYLNEGERSSAVGNLNDQYRLFTWHVFFTGNVRIQYYYDSDVRSGPENLWTAHHIHPLLETAKHTSPVGDAEETSIGGLRFTVESGEATISLRSSNEIIYTYENITP